MADPSLPAPLAPQPGERGVLADLPAAAARIRQAWALFETVVADVDLSGRTRSRGRTARDLLIPLGAWPDARGIHAMVADGRSQTTTAESQQRAEERLRAAHADATPEEVRAMVRRSADHIVAWTDSPDLPEEASLTAPSPLGPVPVGTMIHAAAFQLAVVARDLRPAGAPPSPDLDDLGVAALVDSSGAVAARLSAEASIAAITPTGVAGTGVSGGAWRTVLAPAEPPGLGPGVVAPAGLLVDVAAGRIDLIGMARGLRVRDGRDLVGMSVVLDGIPDLPAAGMLRRAGSLARWGRLA